MAVDLRGADLGPGAAVNSAGRAGTTVSASFHQTEWETMPAQNACDGSTPTSWSTWTGNTPVRPARPSRSQTAQAHLVDQVAFTNTEGTIASVGVEYRDADGQWRPTRRGVGRPRSNGTRTTIGFDAGHRHRPAADLRDTRLVPEDPRDRGARGGPARGSRRGVGGGEHALRRGQGRADGAGDERLRVPVDLATSTPFGSKTTAGVQPGKSVTGAFFSSHARRCRAARRRRRDGDGRRRARVGDRGGAVRDAHPAADFPRDAVGLRPAASASS